VTKTSHLKGWCCRHAEGFHALVNGRRAYCLYDHCLCLHFRRPGGRAEQTELRFASQVPREQGVRTVPAGGEGVRRSAGTGATAGDEERV
jgi:hypothetical protein